MFRIGTFSKLARVSARMLRHYEKCGLFFPADVDRENGYRLYSAEQIPLIGRIIALRDMGFTVQEISDILENANDSAYYEQALKRKNNEIEATINSETDKRALIERALRQMKENVIMAKYEVKIKEIAPVKVLSLRETIPSYSNEGDLWHKMYSFLGKNGIPMTSCNGMIYSLYHDSDYKEQDVDVEIAIPWENAPLSGDGFSCRELEAVPIAACVVSDGPYESIAGATEALAKWIEDNGYEIVGISRGMGIRHPGNEQDPAKFQTEVSFPVAKK